MSFLKEGDAFDGDSLAFAGKVNILPWTPALLKQWAEKRVANCVSYPNFREWTLRDLGGNGFLWGYQCPPQEVRENALRDALKGTGHPVARE